MIRTKVVMAEAGGHVRAATPGAVVRSATGQVTEGQLYR